MLLTLFGSVGCATRTTTVDNWVTTQGGLSTDSDRQTRVNRVASPMASACRGNPVRVRVLSNDAIAAYGWRGGSVFVTRGLVDLLDDEELAAAVAHELGHLLDDGGKVTTVTGLSGHDGTAALDVESRADRIGVDLLTRHNIAPEAMTRMLTKVRRAAAIPADGREALGRRIELLRPVP
jgi:Zn-dependent protease with chaperone function